MRLTGDAPLIIDRNLKNDQVDILVYVLCETHRKIVRACSGDCTVDESGF